MQTWHSGGVYEMFVTPDEAGLVTCINRATGTRQQIQVPADFDMEVGQRCQQCTRPAA